MQRSFLSNLLFLVVVNVLIKPFWLLGVDRTVQNMVGAEAYGGYFALLNLSFLYAMVLDFGMNNFNNRAVARNEGLLEKFLPHILGIKLLLGIGYTLVTLLTGWLIGFGPGQYHLLGWLLLNQILISFILYFRSNIAALQLFRLDAILSITDKAIMIVIVGLMIWGSWASFTFTIAWFVYGQTIAYLITFLVALTAVLLRSKGLTLQWNTRQYKRILSMSYPYALLGLLMTLYNRVDGIMIERLYPGNGAEEAGIYAASYRLLDALNMLGFAFASILFPLFARTIKQGGNVVPIMQQSYRLLLFISISVAVGGYWFKEPIMLLLYPASTPYWATLFSWLMVSFIGVSTMYVYGSLLTAKGSLRKLNILAATGVLVNIVLNAWLIPIYGAQGAAIATVATQLAVAVGHILLARQIFALQYDVSLLVRATLFAVAAVLISGVGVRLSMAWGYQLLLTGIGLFAAGWGLGLLQWKTWLQRG